MTIARPVQKIVQRLKYRINEDNSNYSWERMNKEETLALYEKGLEAWNAWAEEILAQRMKFSEANERMTSDHSWRIRAKADFTDHTFEKEVTFTDFIFPWHAEFDGTRFTKGARFDKSRFHGDARFDKSSFSHDAIFTGAMFSGYAAFEEAKFGHAVFEECSFGSHALFARTIFFGNARFNRTLFTHDALFTGVKFGNAAAFEQAIFQGPGLFEKSSFGSTALFRRVIFGGDVAFENATFNGNASFEETSFRRASFSKVRFSDFAAFKNAAFSGHALFDGSTFSGRAWFSNVTFNRVAWFFNAIFTGRTRFTKAIFNDRAVFDQVAFENFTCFRGTIFKKDSAFVAIQGRSFFTLEDAEFFSVPDFEQAHFAEAPRLDNSRFHTFTAHRVLLGIGGKNSDKTQNLAARWRALKRLALQAHDHERELNFLAEEIKSLRGVQDWLVPNPIGFRKGDPLCWPGGGRYWMGLFYQWFSDFGRSALRPLLWWVLITMAFWHHYLSHPLASFAQESYSQTLSLNKIPHCDPPMAALYISVHNGLVISGLGRSEKLAQSYACLYGGGGEDQLPPIMPDAVVFASIGQNIISAVLIFLFLLSLRNYFRIK